MKAYEGLQAQLHSLLTSQPDRISGQLQGPTPLSLVPQNASLGEPQF